MMKKYVILAVVVLLLVKCLTSRIIDLRFKKICPLVATSTEISRKEVDAFLPKWADYVNRGYMAKVPESFELDGTKMSDRLPWIVKLWFNGNCIDADRFYYVEQRLRGILKAYELKKHTQSVISVLTVQMNTETEPSKKQWYQELIEEQEQISKVEGISDEEISIVAGREETIREILK